MNWSRFFLKGEVDDLSWDVSGFRALAMANPVFGWDLKNLLNGDYTPKNPSLEQLILDPHSIPIERPKDMKRLIKDAIEAKLLDHTNNRWIREIFSATGETAGKKLITSLATAQPFYPEIMSDIYSLSPSGVRDALISRFTMTRTISAITGNPNFSFEIESANNRLLQFLIRRYELASVKTGRPTLPTTAYNTCKKLRSLWGDRVEHSNIGVYCPLDFRLQYTCNSYPMISGSSRADGGFLHETIGPYPPNFGTKTKQKVSDHGFKIVTSSSTVIDLKKIVVTHSELGSSVELARLLTQITSARSPWSISQLSTVMPTAYGGTAAHRHAAINASAFSILGSRTVPTHLNFCSDMAGSLSGGEFDFPIAFQEFYLTLTNFFQVLTKIGAMNTNASIGFRMTDDYEALPTDPVTVDEAPILHWNINPTNKLCYVSQLLVEEIPTVPSANQIKHKTSTDFKPAALIYNRLLAKYCSKRRLFKSTSSVNLPIDVLDMKEFSHCPISELVRGACWFIQSMAIYTSINEFTSAAAVFLNENIINISRSCSALLTRLMLHPSFTQSVYSNEYDITCRPGASGARDAADNLAGELINTVHLSIIAREFLSHKVPLILFADYSATGSICAEIHATTIVALQSFDTKQVLITSFQRLMLRSARQTIIHQDNALNVVLNFRSTVESLANQNSRHTKRHGIARMLVYYCNTTPEEAIRSLRSLPLESRKMISDIPCPGLTRNWRQCTVSFTADECDGSLQPDHMCADTDDRDRTLDSFLVQVHRPYGRYSTAMSVWLTILSSITSIIHGSRVVSIGVGHGAAAASALYLRAAAVIGIDLRSSFPCITQREATYKPPEVIATGRSADFCWSTFVSETGGNILLHKEELKSVESSNIWIIDIEQDTRDTLDILAYIPAGVTLVLRVICCREWAQYIIDSIDADYVFNTSSNVGAHKSSYILVCKKLSIVNEHANYHRRTITSIPCFKTSVVKSTKYSLETFNDWLRRYGERIKVLSASEIGLVASRLRTQSLNCNDPITSREYYDASRDLADAERLFLNYMTITELDILGLTRASRRLLARWLSNTALDLNHLHF